MAYYPSGTGRWRELRHGSRRRLTYDEPDRIRERFHVQLRHGQQTRWARLSSYLGTDKPVLPPDSNCLLYGGVVGVNQHLVDLALLGQQPKLHSATAADVGSNRHVVTGVAIDVTAGERLLSTRRARCQVDLDAIRGSGDKAAASADPLDDGVAAELLGAHDGRRPSDRVAAHVAGRVQVAAAVRRDVPALTQQVVPHTQRHLLVHLPGTVPHLEPVGARRFVEGSVDEELPAH